jgi:peroxiredoxin Q/BCP
MEAYRDQYASIFRGGRGVIVLAVSNDPAEELASWAADSDFPVLFGSDDDNSAAVAYGVGARANGMPQSRAVVVIDPEGRVSWTTPVFREIDPTAYEEVAAAVAAVAPPLDQADDDDAQAANTGPRPQQGGGSPSGC